MKYLTDQERDFLVKMADSIGDVIAANSGVLKTVDKYGTSEFVLAMLPFTTTITEKLQGMLSDIKEYAKVTQLDLIS